MKKTNVLRFWVISALIFAVVVAIFWGQLKPVEEAITEDTTCAVEETETETEIIVETETDAVTDTDAETEVVVESETEAEVETEIPVIDTTIAE